jgi:NitT/TauT family transport system substrate-binding protein
MLMAATDTTLRTASDFNDKTIAEASLADLPYWATKTWLDQNGGNSARVKFVELPLPEMVAALKDHRVDGAVMFEPFVSAAGSDARAVAPVVSSVGKRFISTGWLANSSWLSTHADAARRFAAVMRQTADWANAHPKDSATILLRYTRLTPELASKMVRVQYGTTLNVADLQPPIDDAQKYGAFPRPVTAAELIWAAPK